MIIEKLDSYSQISTIEDLTKLKFDSLKQIKALYYFFYKENPKKSHLLNDRFLDSYFNTFTSHWVYSHKEEGHQRKVHIYGALDIPTHGNILYKINAWSLQKIKDLIFIENDEDMIINFYNKKYKFITDIKYEEIKETSLSENFLSHFLKSFKSRIFDITRCNGYFHIKEFSI